MDRRTAIVPSNFWLFDERPDCLESLGYYYYYYYYCYCYCYDYYY